jgi:cysteinyl-tRNA synthetase
MHCERVALEEKSGDGEKQILPTLDEILQAGFTPREVRFWLVSNHYRKPLAFSKTRLLIQARSSIKRIDACVHGLVAIAEGKNSGNSAGDNTHGPEIDQLAYDIRQGFISAMDDDLNFPRSLVDIFTNIKKINILMAGGQINVSGAAILIDAFKQIDDVMQVFDFSPRQLDPEFQDMMKQREAARAAGDYATADRIRDALRAAGVDVQDDKI